MRTFRLRLNHPNLFPDMGLHSCFVSHILCTKDPLFVLASPSYWIGVTEPRLSCCLNCLNLQEKRSLARKTKKKRKKDKLGCCPTLMQVFVYWNLFSVYLFDRQSFYLFCDTFLEFWQLDMVWRDATKLAQTWLSFLQCSQNSTVVCTVTELLNHKVKGTLQMPTLSGVGD